MKLDTTMLHSHLRYGDFISFHFQNKYLNTQYMFTITLYANQYKYPYKSNIKQATIDSSILYAQTKFDIDTYQEADLDGQNTELERGK